MKIRAPMDMCSVQWQQSELNSAIIEHLHWTVLRYSVIIEPRYLKFVTFSISIHAEVRLPDYWAREVHNSKEEQRRNIYQTEAVRDQSKSRKHSTRLPRKLPQNGNVAYRWNPTRHCGRLSKTSNTLFGLWSKLEKKYQQILIAEVDNPQNSNTGLDFKFTGLTENLQKR